MVQPICSPLSLLFKGVAFNPNSFTINDSKSTLAKLFDIGELISSTPSHFKMLSAFVRFSWTFKSILSSLVNGVVFSGGGALTSFKGVTDLN